MFTFFFGCQVGKSGLSTAKYVYMYAKQFNTRRIKWKWKTQI